jgi:hypothetical protein
MHWPVTGSRSAFVGARGGFFEEELDETPPSFVGDWPLVCWC